MIAVVEIGKKQYIVQKGDTLKVQRLESEDKKIVFDKVLLIADDKKTKVGAPYLDKARIEAEIEEEFKDKKIIVYKWKRRKKYRKTRGHRQILTTLKITRIIASSSQS